VSVLGHILNQGKDKRVSYRVKNKQQWESLWLLPATHDAHLSLKHF
jgi:hypothetical protein